MPRAQPEDCRRAGHAEPGSPAAWGGEECLLRHACWAVGGIFFWNAWIPAASSPRSPVPCTSQLHAATHAGDWAPARSKQISAPLSKMASKHLLALLAAVLLAASQVAAVSELTSRKILAGEPAMQGRQGPRQLERRRQLGRGWARGPRGGGSGAAAAPQARLEEEAGALWGRRQAARSPRTCAPPPCSEEAGAHAPQLARVCVGGGGPAPEQPGQAA